MVREMLDLTGLWRCQPDPYEEGEAEGYHAPGRAVRLWRETAVPGSFDKCAPGMESYEGACWYRRAFEVPAVWRGKRALARFEGVNYHTRVWINGALAGQHEDGFLRFELPIHKWLECGKQNVIVVRADNTRRKGEVPGMQRGWRPYGGILREVILVATDPLHIASTRILAEPQEGGGGALRLAVGLANERSRRARCHLQVDVADGSGVRVASCVSEPTAVPAGGEAQVELQLALPAPSLWSPDCPALYLAKLSLVVGGTTVDEEQVHFGFRRVEVKGGKLLLNGEAVFLTGFNRHEDSPRTGMCTDLEMVRQDLMRMKAVGANFVRLCHYPHHPGELDLCDELGLLAMCEIPLYWWNGLEEGEDDCARKLEAAKRQLSSMIRRDLNHASVIFWSVSNENSEERPEVAAGNDELLHLAKHLDPTRLAVHVSDRWRQHPHFDADDVICVNGYPTWMASARGQQDRFAESAWFWAEGLAGLNQRYPDRPILITEFGYPCLEAVFGGALGEDTQARAIEAEYQGMAAPYVCGTTLWCWADHPWPEEPFIRYLTTGPFGVVGRDRRPLAGLRAVERLFRAKQSLAAPQAGPTEMPPAGWLVNMIRPNLDDIPQVPFPPGFGIRPMKRGEAGLWTDVQRDAEPYLTIEDSLFYEEFGSDLPATEWRCFFITGEKGAAVGTISAWYSRDFKGQDYGRIHWVATRRGHQRRGLAKAGLSYALNRLAQWHERAYLATQTERLPAIKMYLDFGFVPDLDPPGAADAWRRVRANLKHPVLEKMRI